MLVNEVTHHVQMDQSSLPKTDPATQGFHYTEFDYAAPFTRSLDDDAAAEGVDSKTGQAIRLKPVAELDPDAP